MATSTVAKMANLLSILFFAALASAQSVQPSNSTLTSPETMLTVPGIQQSFNIAPLTQNVGAGGSQTAVSAFTASGNLTIVGPTNENNISTSDIAYITCDDSPGFIEASSVVSTVGNLLPKAIVLYSLTSQECIISGSFTFTSIFTMTAAIDSTNLYTALTMSPNMLLGAKIFPNTTSTGQGGSASADNNSGGPAPTTAVAMSILYSITGIITLLFLIIIATGAIRAHRHPERYGPRAGVTGRPRQSRAKGLARAMLETLPIVKFGDPEPVKPGTGDVELEDGHGSVHASPELAATNEGSANQQQQQQQQQQISSQEEVNSGMGPDTRAESIKSGQEPAAKEGELGCSICTEDFTTGEDVRVLPCHHKYHPACIDPWLLNVSGTCPLCRHDLRPVPSASATAEGEELPPPLSANEEGENGIEATGDDASDSNHQRRRVSRFLDLTRLRTAPPEERIAALRRLREQSQRDGEEDVEEHSRRARLTGRLRDTLRIRTRTQNGTQE